MSKKVPLPDDSDSPDNTVFGILQRLLTRLLDVWKGNNPDFLGRQAGDVDTMRFLGLDVELGPDEGTWLAHQQSYIYAFLQEMFDPECLKDRRTLGEPESVSDKPHAEPHAQKARVKHPPLQPGQDPVEHTPVLRFVGGIALGIRITRLATSDEARARVCVRHVAQYLRWTLHFALLYEPVQGLKWHWLQ